MHLRLLFYRFFLKSLTEQNTYNNYIFGIITELLSLR